MQFFLYNLNIFNISNAKQNCHMFCSSHGTTEACKWQADAKTSALYCRPSGCRSRTGGKLVVVRPRTQNCFRAGWHKVVAEATWWTRVWRQTESGQHRRRLWQQSC